VHRTAGFTTDEITDLVAIVHQRHGKSGGRRWPPSLGLRRGVCVTLAYLRRNRTQAELAEAFGTDRQQGDRPP